MEVDGSTARAAAGAMAGAIPPARTITATWNARPRRLRVEDIHQGSVAAALALTRETFAGESLAHRGLDPVSELDEAVVAAFDAVEARAGHETTRVFPPLPRVRHLRE